MDSVSIISFLAIQSKEYQLQSVRKQKFFNALGYQKNIRCYRTIPKQYLPPSFPMMPSDDSKLKTEFLQRYGNLFFEFLGQVITHNEISLTLVESQMKHILSHTEKTIAAANIPAELKESLHKEFTSNNSVPNHTIDSSLMALLPTSTKPRNNPVTIKDNRKRKWHQKNQSNKRPRKSNCSQAHSTPSPTTSSTNTVGHHFLAQRPEPSHPPI